MEKNRTKGFIQQRSFLLSILLHLLLLLLFTIVIVIKPADEEKKHPHLYIPSYVYTGSTAAFKQPRHTQKTQRQNVQHMAQDEKEIETPKNAIAVKETERKSQFAAKKKNKPKQTMANRQQPMSAMSMLAASLTSLKQQQMNSLKRVNNDKPVLLIGDLNQPADPIIRLLAQSLSAHFRYPETEGMLGIKGRVIVEVALHPEGYFTDIRMLKSSTNANLDAAALYAANTAPDVQGANRFLSEPTRFVVGFVFD